MSERWFTSAELREMATPVIQRVTEAIRCGSISEAITLCGVLAEERIVLHDFYADATTALVTWLGREFGEEILEDAYTFIFEESAKRQLYDVLPGQLDRGIEATLLSRSCWIAHGCSGAGEQPASFRLEEDDEKFTFIMDPCGSGGRLWRKGRYRAPFGFALTKRAHAWSYNRKGFPTYCVHCVFLNEILPTRYLGYPLWPVDPPLGPEGECRWYLYKNREAVGKSRTIKRTFSVSQLEEMSTSTPDRIRTCLAKGDRRGAVSVCRQMAGEFLFLHNLYVSGLASGLDFVVKRAGEEALGDVFGYLYRTCMKTQIQPIVDKLTRKDATSWLVFNFFLASTCGGIGYPPAKIEAIEDAQAVTVTLDPCASGGKLLGNGAYRPMGKLRTAKEVIENGLIRASVRLPIPGFVMEAAVPLVVDFLSETRKPSPLQKTSVPFPWSGEIEGLPYTCGLCTALLRESGCDWICVQPPVSPKHACTWRFRK